MAGLRAVQGHDATDDLRRAIRIAEGCQDERNATSLRVTLGSLLAAKGSLADADALLTPAVDHARSMGDPAVAGRALAELAVLRAQQGRPADCRALLAEATETITSAPGYLRAFTEARAAAAEHHLGDPSGARRRLAKARSLVTHPDISVRHALDQATALLAIRSPSRKPPIGRDP